MLRALDMALQQRRHDGVILHSDSNNVSTSFSTVRRGHGSDPVAGKVWCREVFPTA
ncbi:hypothetical protein LMG29542_08516 [Paraburkholderia humisilvae]|uniref:Uncharacterized protein n=1 Tax=Paraburkholderia humisilvae TaxID=627669 RepID=A0A6J5F9G9_9BURK|nr:hypothetical protein LMG29542_08516 [Paraburkholderia humisilvae]